MATRDDLKVLWHLSPRLILVDEPSTNINIQDLHDSLSNLEQEQPNLIYPKIIETAGKEDLGGGTSVGLTATLQNALLGFQARKVWISEGTATTTDATGFILEDTSADFVADGVSPGSWVVNLTDGSIASVFVLNSETSLQLDILGGGSTNGWTSGDSYKIMNVIQMEIDGGNLVSVDGYGDSQDAVLPTAGTQVVRTSASSATTANQAQLEFGTFNGSVWFDKNTLNTGISFPNGTPGFAVNNMPDAITIANTRGFNKITLLSDATLTTGDNLSGFSLEGVNSARSLITVLSGADVSDIEIENATVTGIFDGSATLRDSHLIDIQFVEAEIHNCVLEGTITLDGYGQTAIYNCNDGLVSMTAPPIIDFNGSGRALALRNYSGDILLSNKSGPEGVEVNISTGGRVTLDSTITNGSLKFTGIIEVVDNSTGSANVDTTQVIFPEQLQLTSFNGSVHINLIGGTGGVKFPQGTRQHPVNNLNDALTVASQRGLSDLVLEGGTLVVLSGQDISGFSIHGESVHDNVVVIQSGAITDRTSFKDLTLMGELGGSVYGSGLQIQNLSNVGSNSFPTIFESCMLNSGFFQLRNDLVSPQNIHFVNCEDGESGSGSVLFDMNDGYSSVNFSRYDGAMTLQNLTSGVQSTFSFSDGELTLDATCTNGEIILDGRVEVVNNSSGLILTPRSHLSSRVISSAVWDADLADYLESTKFGGFIQKLLTVAKWLGLR